MFYILCFLIKSLKSGVCFAQRLVSMWNEPRFKCTGAKCGWWRPCWTGQFRSQKTRWGEQFQPEGQGHKAQNSQLWRRKCKNEVKTGNLRVSHVKEPGLSVSDFVRASECHRSWCKTEGLPGRARGLILTCLSVFSSQVRLFCRNTTIRRTKGILKTLCNPCKKI